MNSRPDSEPRDTEQTDNEKVDRLPDADIQTPPTTEDQIADMDSEGDIPH